MLYRHGPIKPIDLKPGATRRQLLRSAGALAMLQLPSWVQAQSLLEMRRPKAHCNVAIIGQFGHGKSTLTAAISKVLAAQSKATLIPYDQLKNAPFEVAYGSKIAIARVQCETEKRSYGLADYPKHDDIVKGMITGAAQIDGGILVVSAADGPTPQTREHILLARQIGLPALVVFLSKMDKVQDRELPPLIESEVRELLSKYNFPADKIPIVRGSALAALEGRDDRLGKKSLLAILKLIDAYIHQPTRLQDRPFLMPIASLSSVGGRTVVSGRIERGIVKAKDDVELVGIKNTQRRKVSSVEFQGTQVDLGLAGQEVRCILQEPIGSLDGAGQVLCKPGSAKPHVKFKAEAYFHSKEEGGQDPMLANHLSQFQIRAANVTGMLVLPQGTEMVMPGDNIEIEVHLMVPIAIERRLRFTIHDKDRIVGIGVVTSITE